MRRDLGLLALRVGVGVTLMAHGYPKLFGGPGRTGPVEAARLLGANFPEAFEQGGIDNFAVALERMGVTSPRAAAVASGVAELGGGLALTLGYHTSVAGTVAAANMVVAARKAHWTHGFYGQGGWEFPALLGLAAAVIAITGPGAFSLDQLRK